MIQYAGYLENFKRPYSYACIKSEGAKNKCKTYSVEKVTQLTMEVIVRASVFLITTLQASSASFRFLSFMWSVHE